MRLIHEKDTPVPASVQAHTNRSASLFDAERLDRLSLARAAAAPTTRATE